MCLLPYLCLFSLFIPLSILVPIYLPFSFASHIIYVFSFLSPLQLSSYIIGLSTASSVQEQQYYFKEASILFPSIVNLIPGKIESRAWKQLLISINCSLYPLFKSNNYSEVIIPFLTCLISHFLLAFSLSAPLRDWHKGEQWWMFLFPFICPVHMVMALRNGSSSSLSNFSCCPVHLAHTVVGNFLSFSKMTVEILRCNTARTQPFSKM